MATNGAAVVPSSPDAGPSQSPRKSTSASASPAREHHSPRASLDNNDSRQAGGEAEYDEDDDATPEDKIARLEDELAQTRQEKEVLGNQYRSLLGKLTAMRTSLGDKLREDAVSRDAWLPVASECASLTSRKSSTGARARSTRSSPRAQRCRSR